MNKKEENNGGINTNYVNMNIYGSMCYAWSTVLIEFHALFHLTVTVI